MSPPSILDLDRRAVTSVGPARSPCRRRQGGFTVVELLVVVAILGLISILVIPNFLQSYQKGKQKRTMADMHKTGQAMVNWLTSQIGAMGAGANTLDLTGLYAPIPHTDLEQELVPTFTSRLPKDDAWGNPYEYFVNIENLAGARVLAIRSAGSDGLFETANYPYGPFVSTAFERDIIWADGIFVRWPVGASSNPP